ncbi:peptidylprolyl isomerase [Bacteroidales bacterium OttesenSCG-928-B11]|nr:peptidylprolyl isomerase [Bacteroidales bacterium OttesenSCG-928-E04]MDL2312604.1 peptidylprolyl isomerase [Bacteroidales bacterium OttesenSCG-928-B11]
MKGLKLTTILFLTISLFACSPTKNGEKKSQQEESTVNVQTEQTTTESKDNQKDTTTDMTKVLIKTSLGDITIALYDETPQHKENFIKLVNDNFYDGVLFHRIIQGFMVQTGDPDSKTAQPGQQLGAGGPGYTIPAEIHPKYYHKRGAVAAARQGDQVNPERRSSGSQFYIVDGAKFSGQEISRNPYYKYTETQKMEYETIGGAPHLDGQYTIFGEVVDGMNVVDLIAAQPKDRGDRPVTDIKIISATIVNE